MSEGSCVCHGLFDVGICRGDDRRTIMDVTEHIYSFTFFITYIVFLTQQKKNCTFQLHQQGAM